MSLSQLVLGPIQQFLWSEREDGLQAGGCLLVGGVIQVSATFDVDILCTATFDVGRDDGLGSQRNPLGSTLYEFSQ